MTPSLPIRRRAIRSLAFFGCLAAVGFAALPTLASDLDAEVLDSKAEAQPGCCLTEAGHTLGFEASEPGPFLDLSGDTAFHSLSDLRAEGAHWVTVTNPYADRSVTVQVRAVTGQVKARSIAVELAPSDSASFDLQPGAVQLMATSEQAFQIQVEDLDYGSILNPEVKAARLGRKPRTNLTSGAAKSTAVYCQGDWTLTCNSTGCTGLGPFTHEGRVERFTVWIDNFPYTSYNVYWNLNTPTGNYTTSNPQGMTATWTPGIGVCPVSVTNSAGHTYTVTTP